MAEGGPPPPAAPGDQAGHRSRLRQRFLAEPGALPDYELLELLLMGAQPRQDTKPVARALLRQFGSFAGAISAPVPDLTQVPGLGEAGIALLKAVREAALRLARTEAMDGPVLNSWDRVIAYCNSAMAREQIEQFRLLFLDKKLRLIHDEVQQRGTVDHTPAYPREIMRRALELRASALILVHNHPSGDPTPSRDDVELTREVVAAGKPLGITVHDHIVIGRRGHASMKGLGLI